MPLIARWLAGEVNARAFALGRILCGIASAVFLLDLGPVVMEVGRGEAPHLPYALPSSLLTAATATWLLALWGVGSIGMILGWRSRVSAWLVAASAGVILLLDAQTYSNHLYLLVLMAALFGCGPSGAAFALEARGREVPDSVPRLAAALIVAQVGIVYTFAALAKVNVSFLSGETVAGYLPRWMVSLLDGRPGAGYVVLGLSVSAVVLELVVGLGLLTVRYRRDAFLLGFLIHVGMVVAVHPGERLAIAGFAVLMFAAYLPALGMLPIQRVVVWDDTCSSCATWVRWFRRLDWLGALRFEGSSDPQVLERHGLTREEADASMWVLGDDGRASGFRGVIEVLEQLPVTFLWARLLRFPLVRLVGERLYRRHALRRHCALPVAGDSGVAAGDRSAAESTILHG